MDDDLTSFQADLTCDRCGVTGPHRLTYAGRLLVNTHCDACGAEQHRTTDALRSDYLHDLEQRVASKPRRMVRRLGNDPVGFLASLPLAVVRKPYRMLVELRALRRG